MKKGYTFAEKKEEEENRYNYNYASIHVPSSRDYSTISSKCLKHHAMNNGSE